MAERRRLPTKRQMVLAACMLGLVIAVVSERQYAKRGGPAGAIRPGPAGPERAAYMDEQERRSSEPAPRLSPGP